MRLICEAYIDGGEVVVRVPCDLLEAEARLLVAAVQDAADARPAKVVLVTEEAVKRRIQ